VNSNDSSFKNFSTLISVTDLWTVETEVMKYETDSESGQREGEKLCKPSKLVLAGKAV